MNILITGGAGFLGSHLVDKLIEKNHHIIVLDSLLTGDKTNINEHIESNNVEFLNHDVQNYIEVAEGLDIVMHLASAAAPNAYTQFPINTLKAGSIGTINTLGLAKSKKAKYLLVSTSEIYGDPKESPQKETYWGNVNPIGPRSMYDEAKRFSEACVASYNKIHNLNTRIVRLFNTYGPRLKLNDGRVVTNFIYQALKNENITVYGDGTQTRSFCFVTDTVEGIIKALDSNSGEVFNIGNPQEITVNQLAETIIKLTNSSSKIEFKELPIDDPLKRKPDITKARELLDWQPNVGLEEGLQKTINWVNSKIN
jgi:dTDP-glucose 4,6-dehydratase